MEMDQKSFSVLKDDGFCANRILARESSTGESSRIFYRANDGVPFQWEMCPGTPKHPQLEDDIPPLSPTPLMQSLGLPLPNIDYDQDDDKGSVSRFLKFVAFKEMVKKSMKSEIMKKVEKLSKRRGGKKQESSSFEDSDGEFVSNSVKDSSFSSYSSSLSFSPSDRGCVMDSSRTTEGPLCCSPWNFSAILDEGNTRIYYCRQHKTAFTVEDDRLILSKILSTVSASKQFSGPLQCGITAAEVPFNWEMQPGTPKNPPENELIPPPSPPPAVQRSAMPRPNVHIGDEEDRNPTWKRVQFWIKKKHDMKEAERKYNNELSFRHHKKDICCSEEGFDASFREPVRSSSLRSVSRSSKGIWSMSKIKSSLKGSYFSWAPRTSKKVIVSARKKLKSLTF